MTETAQRYRTLAAEFTRRVTAVPADRWDAPSPCEGWRAHDVLTHVIALHRDFPTYAGIPVEPARFDAARDPSRAWAEARDGVQAFLEDPAQAGAAYEGYLGPTTFEETVDRFICFDLLIHGWDIARATGQEETLPQHEVSRVYADALRLGDGLRLKGVCGPAVPVADDASEQDRLLAFLGRTP